MGCGCTRSAAVGIEPWQPVVPLLGAAPASSSTQPCNSIMVARLRQQRPAAEEMSSMLEVLEFQVKNGRAMTVSALQQAIQERWEVPPGRQLLSCIDEQMHQGQQDVPPDQRVPRVHLLEPEVRDSAGIRQSDRCIGEFGFPAANLFLHLTDFRKLRPAQATEPFCRIPEVRCRGITLAQVQRLVRFVKDYTGPGDLLMFWCDRHVGKAIHSRDLNFYTLRDWVIGPSTYSSRCSFSELLAVNAAEQLPRWFSSHWWGMPLQVFLQSLKDHCRVRGFLDTLSYWFAAGCLNQLQLGQELAENFQQSGTIQALQDCDGMLFMVDTQGVALQRSWCCFEAYWALQPDQKRVDPLLFDIAVACKNPQAGLAPNSALTTEICTDGLVEAELKLEQAGLSGWSAKAKREAYFPLHVVSQGLTLDVRNARTSKAIDHCRILNLIAQRPAQYLDEEPFVEDPGYEGFNAQLRSVIAVSGWRQCVDQHGMDRTQLSPSRLSRVVRADANRSYLQLGFAHCGVAFDNARLKEVGYAIHNGMTSIQLVIDGCMVDFVGISSFLHRLPPGLESLALGLARTRVADGDMGTLSHCLPKELSHLELGLAGTNITELRQLRLPSGLVALDLNIGNIPVLSKTALSSMAVPKHLQLLHLQLRRTGLCMQDVVQFCKLLPECLQVIDFQLDGTGLENFSGFSLPRNLSCLAMSLGGNRQFTDAGLIALARALPENLSQLIVSFRATGVGDKGMAALSQALPQSLEEFVLTLGGSAVTEAGLRSLARGIESLRHLMVLNVDCTDGVGGSSCHSRLPGDNETAPEVTTQYGQEFALHSAQARGKDHIAAWCRALLR